ncbi:MAG: hypothetical protein M1818_002703 [Claussenomyces sp. TS43310]|nr:MAG: hypothetical protein M1818_002703 [Claussenomyces sp. TS43310]
MSASQSKRQQARNERTLQDLIKSIPGNNLGIFLCMRCAALHRKLGTHISKVKSLSMDSWTVDQVERRVADRRQNMKRTGNLASNRKYNPLNTRPPIPIDVDEADSAMERFIRQKYQDQDAERGLERERHVQAPARHHYSGSTESDEPRPTLPPKSGSRFGFRSASSIFPMSSKAKREAAARAQLEAEKRERDQAPPLPTRNKQSKVFGQHVGADRSGLEDLDTKLEQLRDMGFMDERRNVTVLKGLNGNVEKSIETLVRLGGGLAHSSRSRTPPDTGLAMGLSNTAGLSIPRTRDRAPSSASNNPWEISNPAPPQSSQSTGTLLEAQAQLQAKVNPYQANGNNPFGLTPSKSQYSLNKEFKMEEALQNLSIQPQQPLFPNHTGGTPQRQPFHASAVPPMPTIPQGQYQGTVYNSQAQQPYSPHASQSYNPFLQQQQRQQAPANQQSLLTQQDNTFSNPYGPHMRSHTFPLQNSYDPSQQQQQTWFDNQPSQQLQSQASSNPFGYINPQLPQSAHSQQLPSNPFLFQAQQAAPQSPHQQTSPYGQQIQQYSQPPQQAVQPQQPNPYSPQSPYAPPEQQQQQQQQQNHNQMPAHSQALMPQRTGFADKSSILALYNLPQSTPAPPQSQPTPNGIQSSQPFSSQQQNQVSFGFQSPNQIYQQSQPVSSPQTEYGASARHPFMTAGGLGAANPYGQTNSAAQASNGANGARHISQESMSVDAGGWHSQNGRHSPDAFASLSARSFR